LIEEGNPQIPRTAIAEDSSGHPKVKVPLTTRLRHPSTHPSPTLPPGFAIALPALGGV
jgi:hypothetical protein